MGERDRLVDHRRQPLLHGTRCWHPRTLGGVFNLSGSEVIVILLLALVVLGPEKLPEAMRRAGKAYADLKRMSNGFQQEFRSAMDEPLREVRSTADLMRSTIEGAAGTTTPATPVDPAASVEPLAPDLSGPDHPMHRDGPPSEPDPTAPTP
jgi:Tat protein translocase TatB subunit